MILKYKKINFLKKNTIPPKKTHTRQYGSTVQINKLKVQLQNLFPYNKHTHRHDSHVIFLLHQKLAG
jgi:hypothetical protein